MISADWYSFHGAYAGFRCPETALGILCFLCFARAVLVIGSDGQRTEPFRYGGRSVADSRCTMAR